MKDNYFAIIIAGGKGERLWPLSRERIPKPFIYLNEETLIQKTYKRISCFFKRENIFVLIPPLLKKITEENIPEANILIEPEGKNTTPACIYATWTIYKKNRDGILGIFPADHIIKKEQKFLKALGYAFKLAEKDQIITFGIKPTRPETGYGYIQVGEKILNKKGIEAFYVKKFHEKPNLKKVRFYIKSKNFFWNSGIFVWRAKGFLEILKEISSPFFPLLEKYLLTSNNVNEFYKFSESVSIDYAVLEKTKKIITCVSRFIWEDLGSFLSFEKVFKNKKRNTSLGKVYFLDSYRNIGISQNGIVVGFGIKDLIVVHTQDITLVLPKKFAQNVKEILYFLKGKEKNIF